jgi:hypothetical protein
MGIHGIFHTRLSIGKKDMSFYCILLLISIVNGMQIPAVNRHMRLRFNFSFISINNNNILANTTQHNVTRNDVGIKTFHYHRLNT